MKECSANIVGECLYAHVDQEEGTNMLT